MTQMTHAPWGASSASCGRRSDRRALGPPGRRLRISPALPSNGVDREAMCGGDYFVLAPDESLDIFRARLKKIRPGARRRRGVGARRERAAASQIAFPPR
jgi:hypothetical protein